MEQALETTSNPVLTLKETSIGKRSHFDHMGINSHTEHLTDLILSLAPGNIQRFRSSFKHSAQRLIRALRQEQLYQVNEKIDGSPAILIGFDASNQPFISYKGGLSKRGPQKLLRTLEDVETHYDSYKDDPDRSGLYELFCHCVDILIPKLQNIPNRDLMFQGDLLFVKNDSRRVTTDDEITIRANPNGVTYKISKDHELFKTARDSKLGLVVHTAINRQLDSLTGKIFEGPRDDFSEVIKIVDLIKDEDVMILHPLRESVLVSARHSTQKAKRQTIRELNELVRTIENNLTGLDRKFLSQWHRFEPLMRIYLNRGLRGSNAGGIYKAARDRELFDFDKLCSGFEVFLDERSKADKDKSDTQSILKRVRASNVQSGLSPSAQRFKEFKIIHEKPLSKLLEAYFLANRFQFELHKHLEVGSILGGGEIEGLMLEDSDRRITVKLVDRLTFTIRNNAQRLNSRASTLDQLSDPFTQVFADNTIFYPIKGQPFHAGHIAAISKIASDNPNSTVVVLASIKEPNLSAKHWKQTQLSDSRKKIVSGEFNYAFSVQMRQQLIQGAKFPENVQIHFTSPNNFWSYLRIINEKITTQELDKLHYHIALGDKEKDHNRYDDQLNLFKDILSPLYIKPQIGGISGTDVREAFLMLTSEESGQKEKGQAILEGAFNYISDLEEKERLINALIEEWHLALAVSERFKIQKPKKSGK